MTKVLVIEDEKQLRENIILMLQFENFDALGAEDGIVGVQKAKEHKPNLIVCDIMMPRLDGYGVLMELQSDIETATIPLLFLTAKAEKDDVRRGMVLGADDYLTKPFTNQELLEAITARLQKHENLSQHYERKVDELRESISMNLPHELRTPLTAILGYSAYMVDEVADLDTEQILHMAQSIYRSGRRLHRLVENYLMYAQLEFVKYQPETIKRLQKHYAQNPIYPADSIRWLVEEKVQERERASDIVLELDNIPMQIPEDDIKKIADELIDNALKFSAPGTPIYLALLANTDSYGLRVNDEGRGMTPEHIAQIGAYVQFDRKIYEQQGVGLGLAIVKRLAELYGGKMRVQSEPGKGTTVEVVFKYV